MTRQSLQSPGVRRIVESLRAAPSLAPPRRLPFDDALSEEAIAERVEAARVVPSALDVACVLHSAEPGWPCFGRRGERGSGVCADRLARRPLGGVS